ncbi:MAG: hypothetical protein ACK5OB_06250 [Pirellula sp.]
MRSRQPNWVRFGLILTVMAGSQVGCSSGWKMPSSDMFSWKRKPSESTLTGSSPSIAMPENSKSSAATSPATRNTPSPISSTAANNKGSSGKQSSPYGQSANPNPTTGTGLNASFAGFQSQPSTLGQSAPVSGGSAAGANGFSPGTYNAPTARMATPGAPGTPAPYGSTAPNPYSLAPAPGSQPSGGVPNPGAPTLGAPSVNAPSYSVPSPVPAVYTAPGPSNPPGGYPVGANPGFAPTGGNPGLAPAPAPAPYTSPLPPSVPFNSGASNGLTPPYIPASSSPVPASPVSYGTPGLQPAAGVSSAPAMPNANLPVAYGGTIPPNPSASNANSAATADYRPGSMNRNTPYNFSTGDAGASGTGNPGLK